MTFIPEENILALTLTPTLILTLIRTVHPNADPMPFVPQEIREYIKLDGHYQAALQYGDGSVTEQFRKAFSSHSPLALFRDLTQVTVASQFKATAVFKLSALSTDDKAKLPDIDLGELELDGLQSTQHINGVLPGIYLFGSAERPTQLLFQYIRDSSVVKKMFGALLPSNALDKILDFFGSKKIKPNQFGVR